MICGLSPPPPRLPALLLFAHLLLLLLLLLLVLAPAAPATAADGTLANYVPVKLPVAGRASLDLQIPTRPSSSRGINQAALFRSSAEPWKKVVEKNQAGLVDAKQEGKQVAMPPLSPQEAWHHHQAAQAGVIDSARFLLAFTMVPSVQSGGSELWLAASHGHVARVQELLDDGHDPNEAKELDGLTPLHAATTMNHPEVVKVLIDEGALVESVGKSGVTPLMMAASIGHVDVATVLLDCGADPDTLQAFAETAAIHMAAEMGHSRILKLLCERGANAGLKKKTGGTALHTAADTNQAASVAVLIDSCGLDPGALLNGDTTPLYLAAQRGFVEPCRALLERGADVNFAMPLGRYRKQVATISSGGSAGSSVQGPPGSWYGEKNLEIGNGATALHAAVENGHPKVVELLLDHGAEQGTSMQGASPLLIALQYRHPRIAEILLQHPKAGDPRINAQTPQDGAFPLFVAAGSGSGYEKVAELLLAKGADPTLKNKQGATALSHAVHTRNHHLAATLLRHPLVREDAPDTMAMQAAIEAGMDEALSAMLKTFGAPEAQEGGSVGASGDNRGSASLLLHTACRRGRVTAVKALLRAGANATMRAVTTRLTPLHAASSSGQQEVVAHLLAHLRQHATSSKALTRALNARAGKQMYGATPLYLAAQNGHAKVAKLLLDHGARFDPRLSKINATPLFIAAERGHLEVVTMLMKQGANVNIRNWNGLTPLAMAAVSGRVEVVEVIAQRGGAAVDTESNAGATPLLTAARGSDSTGESAASSPALIDALVKLGASVDFRDPSSGETPLLAAAGRVVAALEAVEKAQRGEQKAGAQQKLLQALRPAVDNAAEAVKVARRLLAAGADAAARDSAGATALELVSQVRWPSSDDPESTPQTQPAAQAVTRVGVGFVQFLFEDGQSRAGPLGATKALCNAVGRRGRSAALARILLEKGGHCLVNAGCVHGSDETETVKRRAAASRDPDLIKMVGASASRCGESYNDPKEEL